MATRDPSDADIRPQREEGAFIGVPLRQIMRELGVESVRAFAKHLGWLDPSNDVNRYSHLNNLVTDVRPAGMGTILELAERTGKPVAFFFGDDSARPIIGTMDAFGRITMQTRKLIPCLVLVDGAAPGFIPGTHLQVDPSVYRTGAWLVVRSLDTDEVWCAWARKEGRLRVLVRPGGEVRIFSEKAHEVMGAIVGVVVAPPGGPSA